MREFETLQLKVLQRDWLSSNNVVMTTGLTAVVDTGYDLHSEQTVALVHQALQGQPLHQIVNTHLHSDHCGGNAALQAAWPAAQTWVPEGAWSAVSAWDEDQLTYRLTGQTCRPFRAQQALRAGQTVQLGRHDWQIHATPGHDPDAVVLFEPTQRVLISGDALWRNRIAVLFPELDDRAGFAPALATLDQLEALDPLWVIPGHGAPFGRHEPQGAGEAPIDAIADALSIARRRLRSLAADPAAHARHAARVLTMFHLMEHRRQPREQIERWFAATPLARQSGIQRHLGSDPQAVAAAILDGLVRDGALAAIDDLVVWNGA